MPSPTTTHQPSSPNPIPPPLSQSPPGASTKPSKSKGRTKKPRPAPPTPFSISASPHLTPEEKDCLVKAMALPVGDHIASRGKHTPHNVLDEIREDQDTIALAQTVLETPHRGKGKAADKLAPSRNMLASIGEWLTQEYAQTERCLQEIAAADAAAAAGKGKARGGAEEAEPSSSKSPPVSAGGEKGVGENIKSQQRRKARKKPAAAGPSLRGVDTKVT